MTLKELIIAVKEEGLTKSQLEQYHTEITYLDNIMRMEIAPLEKEEALYFQMIRDNEDKLDDVLGATIPRQSDVEIKRQWRATEKGQRQIELSHYLKITPKLLQSIRTRLYSIY